MWAEFDEGIKRGPTYSENDNSRRKWVPIALLMSWIDTLESENGHCGCKMCPLRLCCAFTPWKVQGQTIDGKLVTTLGMPKISQDLSYIVFSTCRVFSNLLIDGSLTFDQITNKILSSVYFRAKVKYKRESHEYTL